jgi:hypothetical protein
VSEFELLGGPKGEKAMKTIPRAFLCAVACIAAIAFDEVRAQYAPQWITKDLDAGRYKLSAYEENGVYYCSVGDARIIDMQFENGYAQIIFEHDAPRFFQEKEISPNLLKKLRIVQIGQFYNLLCVHSFFRDDWQARYDAEHTVNDRLLNITKTQHTKTQDKDLVTVP